VCVSVCVCVCVLHLMYHLASVCNQLSEGGSVYVFGYTFKPIMKVTNKM
jgi:hypothetical protein